MGGERPLGARAGAAAGGGLSPGARPACQGRCFWNARSTCSIRNRWCGRCTARRTPGRAAAAAWLGAADVSAPPSGGAVPAGSGGGAAAPATARLRCRRRRRASPVSPASTARGVAPGGGAALRRATGRCWWWAARRCSTPPRPANWRRRSRRSAPRCYLAGGARAACSASHALQLRHRRKEALREADLVVLAGIPTDFRLDYGRGTSTAAPSW
jgi:hypothetical protein